MKGDKEGRKARANSLREQIEELKKSNTHNEGPVILPQEPPPESPKEYVERKGKETEKKQNESPE